MQEKSDFPYNVRCIPEQESEHDAFGIHTKTAESLCKIITDNEKTSIRSIGLFGNWGSGKSTVIKLAEQCLKEKNTEKDKDKYLFFTFDVWLNQGDNARTAFLESLLENALAKKYLDDSFYEEQKNALTGGGKEENIEHTKSYFTPYGVMASTVILFIPLASRLFNWGCGFSVRNIIAVLIPLLPFLFSMLYLVRKRLKSKGEKWSEIPNIFSGNASEIKKKVSYKSPTATSIAFNTIYQKILENLTLQGLHLIIVFDNLDRVEKQAALAMWAVIRSILTSEKITPSSSKDKNTSIRTPFILIPLDKKSIKYLYDSDNDKCLHRAESFADKTFDITLELRPPIFSDWTDYLKAQIEYAFGKDIVGSKEFLIIKKLFDIAQEDANHYLHSITPRKINTIINNVVAEYYLWGTQFTYPTLFYYILFKDSIAKNFPDTKEALGVYVIERHNKEWLEDIIALYYGVEKEKAIQIYLDTAIIDCIKNKHQERFIDSSNFPEFVHIFEKTINQNNITTSDATYLLRCAYYIYDEHVPLSDDKKMYVLESIYPTLRKMNTWTFDKEDMQGIRVFLDSKVGTSKEILNLFTLSCKEDESPKESANKFNVLLEILRPEEKEEYLDSLTFLTSSEHFIYMLGSLKGELVKKNKGLLHNIEVKSSDKQNLEEVFKNFTFQTEHDTTSLNVLCLLRDMKNIEVDWDTIFQYVQECIQSGANGNITSSTIWGVKALLYLCVKDHERTNNLVSSRIIENLYHRINISNYPEKEDALSYLTILFLLYSPNYAQNLISQRINNQSEFPRLFASTANQIIEETGKHEDIFYTLLNSSYNSEFFDPIVKELIYYKIKTYGNLGIVYTNILSDFLHMLFYFIDDDTIKQRIIHYYSCYEYFYERFHLIQEDSVVYDVINAIDGHKNQTRVYDVCFDYLAQKDEEWWEGAFARMSEEEFPLNWLATHQLELPNKKFNEIFSKKLDEHRKNLVSNFNTKRIPLVKKEWGNLLEFVDKDTKNIFLENLYDTIFVKDISLEIVNTLFSLFITKLKEMEKFTNGKDACARKILDIVNSDDIYFEDMHMSQDPIEYTTIIQGAENSTKKELRNSLVNIYKESEDEEEKNNLEKTIKEWKFRLPKKVVTPPENEEK